MSTARVARCSPPVWMKGVSVVEFTDTDNSLTQRRCNRDAEAATPELTFSSDKPARSYFLNSKPVSALPPLWFQETAPGLVTSLSRRGFVYASVSISSATTPPSLLYLLLCGGKARTPSPDLLVMCTLSSHICVFEPRESTLCATA